MGLRTKDRLLLRECVASWRQARQRPERLKLYVLRAFPFEVESKLIDDCVCVVTRSQVASRHACIVTSLCDVFCDVLRDVVVTDVASHHINTVMIMIHASTSTASRIRPAPAQPCGTASV